MEQQGNVTLTVKEIMRALNISKPAAYRYLNSGAIPAIRLGHRWIIPRSGFNEWLRTIGGKLPVPA